MVEEAGEDEQEEFENEMSKDLAANEGEPDENSKGEPANEPKTPIKSAGLII